MRLIRLANWVKVGICLLAAVHFSGAMAADAGLDPAAEFNAADA